MANPMHDDNDDDFPLRDLVVLGSGCCSGCMALTVIFPYVRQHHLGPRH